MPACCWLARPPTRCNEMREALAWAFQVHYTRTAGGLCGGIPFVGDIQMYTYLLPTGPEPVHDQGNCQNRGMQTHRRVYVSAGIEGLSTQV